MIYVVVGSTTPPLTRWSTKLRESRATTIRGFVSYTEKPGVRFNLQQRSNRFASPRTLVPTKEPALHCLPHNIGLLILR